MNATIADNTSNLPGGGIRNFARSSASYSSGGFARVSNSIIAGNSGGDLANIGFSFPANILFSGNNIVADGSVTGANIINADPGISDLGDHGGATQTHFLLPGSIAIDAGDDAVIVGSEDQRGGSRQINTVDIGALEFQGTNLVITAGNGQSTLIDNDFPDTLTIQATEKTFATPLEGLTVFLSSSNSSSSGGTDTEPGLAGGLLSGVTDANGQVTFDLKANGVAGNFEVVASASAGGLDSASVVGNLTNTETVLIDTCEPDCGTPSENDNVPNQPQEEELLVGDIQDNLRKTSEQTGVNTALIYALFKPVPPQAQGNNGEGAGTKQRELKQGEKFDPKPNETQWEFRGDRLTNFLNSATEHFLDPADNLRDEDQLQLVMITPNGQVIERAIPGATRKAVFEQARLFFGAITDPRQRANYLDPAQYLYDVLVRPLEAELGEQNIENLTYVMDDGLRILPLAALHDGEQFIVEKYSVGLMPSFSLTNTSDYVPPRDNLVLAMGAATFPDEDALPAAPLEVEVVAEKVWQGGEAVIGDQFTVAKLIEERQRRPIGILHLATHGNFDAGSLEDSYIQFADEKVTLDEIDRLQLGNPPLELLVLSACRTAFGDAQSELGFAGLALNSGAKSAIGSMWYVSDSGTLGLMTRFYEELQDAPIKAEALRQAQLSLLSGEVRIEGNQLITQDLTIDLPEEVAQAAQQLNLSHPFFWSGFALVGNPW